MSRGGYEKRSDRSGNFGGRCADAGEFVHWPQESDGRETRGGERGVGTSGRRAATASGLDPQSCGDGEGLCGAGANCFRRYRESPFRSAWRAFSGISATTTKIARTIRPFFI